MKVLFISFLFFFGGGAGKAESLDQMKSFSGLRFSEISGSVAGQNNTHTSPVVAGRSDAVRAQRIFKAGTQRANLDRKQVNVPSPEKNTGKSNVAGTALGGTVGFLAGVGSATVLGLIPSLGTSLIAGLVVIVVMTAGGAYLGSKAS